MDLTEIRTADPFPMISQKLKTQFIASRPFPVTVSGIIPLPSIVPVHAGVKMPTLGHRDSDSSRISTLTIAARRLH